MTTSATQVTQALLVDISSRGESIYSGLKPLLEPASDRKFVAIHVDSGDYEVAKTAGEAARVIRKRQPLDGRLYVRKIGEEPDFGLAARIVASEMNAQAQE